MSKIGGVPPPAVPPSQTTNANAKQSQNTKQNAPITTRQATKLDEEHDRFETRETGLASRLQAARGKSTKLQFQNVELADLVKTYAAVLKQNPNADRLKRAKLFAKAVLKRRKLSKLFSGTAESDLENLCDAIAEQLEASPVFGQLLDEVSQQSSQITTG